MSENSKIEWTQSTCLIPYIFQKKNFIPFFFWLLTSFLKPIKHIFIILRAITTTASRHNIAPFCDTAFTYWCDVVIGGCRVIAVSANAIKINQQPFFTLWRDSIDITPTLTGFLFARKAVISICHIAISFAGSMMCYTSAIVDFFNRPPHLAVNTPRQALLLFIAIFLFGKRFNPLIYTAFTFCFLTIKTRSVVAKFIASFPQFTFSAMLQTALCKSQIFFNGYIKFFRGAFNCTFFCLRHNYIHYNTLGV